jgi:hypothetical protein
MKHVWIALLLGLASPALADDEVPATVKPFISEADQTYVGSVFTVTGTFGAKDTMVVVWWDMRKAGTYKSFALVPDAKAKAGFQKLAVAKVSSADVIDGKVRTAYQGNLDKDADDELVLELTVQKSQASQAGGFSYRSYEYVVLDYKNKQLVRVPALEKKLAAKMKSRESEHEPLGDADLKAALGVK